VSSIYPEADVLKHDQEAGCVEHPRHIRLSLNGAGNLGRTTCFFPSQAIPNAIGLRLHVSVYTAMAVSMTPDLFNDLSKIRD
jgi:hypothetical protein